MADSPQLTADKTTAKPGELITFTWTWGGPNDGTDLSGHSLTFQLKARRSGSIDFEVIESGIGQNARTIQTAYPADNPDWVMYKISAFYIAEGSTTYEYNSAACLVSQYGSGSEDPAPTTGGRLEQFQNSAAEPVYPRTIIEGIFRQSDSRTLGEILGLCAPKADPVFTGSISLGRKAGTAAGELSFASGSDVEASGANSHAEGIQSAAVGNNSHAEGGGCTANESCDHAEGHKCTASGGGSHAEGGSCVASGRFAHAEGAYNEASGLASHAGGCGTVATAIAQTVIGSSNVISAEQKDTFIIGNGGFNEDTVTSRSNCFRVTRVDGVYANSSYNSSGADYAEMFEWADGNPNNEDRAGRFVTLDGAKIRPAGPEDGYILGIVSGNPSVVGDVQDDQWQGMYLCDIYGRPVWEDVDIPEVKDDTGFVIFPARRERRQKLNPDYDSAKKYIPRSQRPEWNAVGMLGKLVAVDDGTCVVNGWCAVGAGGVATASESRTKYRVMERLDKNHIRVMIL